MNKENCALKLVDEIILDLLLLISMISFIKEVCIQKWGAVKELFA